MMFDFSGLVKARIRRTGMVSCWFFHVDGSPDLCGREWLGRLRDLSDFGVGIEIDRSLEAGTKVGLRVGLADPPSLTKLQGEVKWCRAGDRPGVWLAGMQFHFPSAAHSEAWRRIVANARDACRRTEAAAA